MVEKVRRRGRGVAQALEDIGMACRSSNRRAEGERGDITIAAISINGVASAALAWQAFGASKHNNIGSANRARTRGAGRKYQRQA